MASGFLDGRVRAANQPLLLTVSLVGFVGISFVDYEKRQQINDSRRNAVPYHTHTHQHTHTNTNVHTHREKS